VYICLAKLTATCTNTAKYRVATTSQLSRVQPD
jgi:hypothetical protein